ncbi:hypothetical protein EAS64_33905 [Trebonia kvetii]|uniref:Uncharacterized protein n=1 Tax=Trebonia kvetii TaxID=2480626 RepID=A0A6P2BSS6_9ACTN|nr:hypothetical protein [Trebonia kvetii]TVZ01276.1 hypothetical protein EAS64_33905 [Trebonia kvetii]
MNLKEFAPKIAAAKKLIDGLNSNVVINIDAEVAAAEAKIKALRDMAGRPVTFPVRADIGQARTAARVAGSEFYRTISGLTTGRSSGLPPAYLKSIQQRIAQRVAMTTAEVMADEQRAASSGSNFFSSMPGWAGWLGALFTNKSPVPLFGNALNLAYNAIRKTDSGLPTVISHLVSMSAGWHLASEAVIEFAAVWAPASIALTAFGAAAYPTALQIYKQLKNMNTAAQATGQQFTSLATKGQSLSQAVKPSVLEAFGIALYTIQRNSGHLAGPLASIGQSIDQITARASVALSHTNGSFFQTGARDVGLLMTAFGNLFGIFGALARAVPGYAEVLLTFGTQILGFGERVAQGIEPALGWFLKLHGAIFYGGLFGTAAAWGFTKVVAGLTSITEGIASLAVKAGLAEPIIAGLGKVLLFLDTAGSGPVIAGVALVAGGLAGLIMYLRAGRTAAQAFGSSMQQALSTASAGQLQGLLKADTAANAERLAAATQTLTAAQSAYNATLKRGEVYGNPYMPTHRGGLSLPGQNAALRQANQAVDGYRANAMQLSSEQVNLHSNLARIAHDFGVSLPNALGLASAAQVTNNQLLGSGADNLAQIEALINGYMTQLKVMTDGTGNLGSALHALNVTTSSQYQAIQNVTGAYSTWIGIVTGGDSAFTTFEQGQKTLITDLQQGGEKVRTTLGKISDSFTTVKSTLNGTSDSSLAARQAFDAQINSAVSLYNALATMAAVSGNSAVAQHALYQAGKDIVAQMLPLAAGSKQAATMVYALAQIAGYAGDNSLAGMSKWLGHTKNAEKDLNKQQGILTQSTATLSQDAKNLASGLQGVLTQAMVNAIANTAQLNQATQNLSDAFGKSHGKINSNVTQMANNYIQSLKQMGFSNSQIEGALGALADTFMHNRTQAQKWADQIVTQAARAQAAIDAMHGKTITVNTIQVTQAPYVVTQPPPQGGHHGGATGFLKGSGGFRGSGAGGGPAEIHNHVHLDGKEIYRSVQKNGIETERRTGTNGLGRRTR